VSRWASTLWLFRAGVVAALLQFVTVLLVVPGFALLSHEGLIEPIHFGRAGQVAASPLLPWSCLLLAMNSAMTNRQVRAQTAARIRRMSQVMKPTAPDEFTHDLIAQTCLGVIAMAMLALVAPPNFVLGAAGLVGCSAIAAIGWPALASIGAAWFGAIAFAARHAL
jgi:hypothetical protein